MQKEALNPSIACEAGRVATQLSLVIGPEGGLSMEEIAVARGHEAVTVSLGPLNLRSETAAIAAVARLMEAVES